MVNNQLDFGEIIAYSEKDSLTGPGILRQEWRVSRVTDWPADDLVFAWGDSWRRYKPFAEFVLDQRYIRSGVEKPWRPFESANTYEQALGYIDSRAIPACPVLIELNRKRDEQIEKQGREREKVEQEKRSHEEKARLKKESEAAFGRMSKSKRFGHRAQEWHAFVVRHGNDHDRDMIRNDEKALQAYDAVMVATAVNAKASAIRRFFVEVRRLGFTIPNFRGES